MISTASSSVECQGLAKSFGKRSVLDGIALRLAPGSTVGVVGANGSGKTTLLSLLAGYIRPTSGSIRLLGHPPTDVRALVGLIGVMPQEISFLPHETVQSFLMYLARTQRLSSPSAEVDAALSKVGATAHRKSHCATLAFGWRRRICLAAALLGAPQVLLFDEPTSGLDREAARGLYDLLRQERGSRTIVLASHDQAEMEAVCDDMRVLQDGKLVEHSARASGRVQQASADHRSETAAIERLGAIGNVANAGVEG